MQHFFKLHCYEIPDRWWKRGCYSAICPHLGVSQMLFRLSAKVIFLCSKNLLGDDPMCHSKHAMFLTLSHHPRPSSSQVWQRRVSPVIAAWPPLCNGASCLVQKLQGPWPSRPPERPSAPDPTSWVKDVLQGLDVERYGKGGWAWCTSVPVLSEK